MLQPIEGHPTLFRDGETNQIYNILSFGPLDKVYPFDRWDLNILLHVGESWLLRRWSILMHPWPEVISPALTVSFQVGYRIVADIPLFEAARPVARPETTAIEARLDALEKALQLRERGATDFHTPMGRLIDYKEEICVRVSGPADDFTLLREMTKVFSLRLEGLRRSPIP